MKPIAFTSGAATAALILSLTLTACDGKPSAVASRDSGVAGAYGGANGPGRNRGGDPRDLPVPKIDGKPLWAANRQHSAEENAEYQFGKNGGDFGAKTETDYVTKVHAFVDKPPRDVQTLDRANGDRLMYDPKANVFAVISRDGAPRTMFKPRGGASYWSQQKEREASRGKTGQGGGSDQGSGA